MKKIIFYMLILLLSVTAISCGTYDFWDQFATESSKMPASISFIDADPDEDFLSGDINIGKAENEKNVSEYRIYWGSSADVKFSSTPVAALKPTGSDLTLTLSHMHVPSGATHLIAVSAGSEGEMTKHIAIDFEDLIVRLEKDMYPGVTDSIPVWLTALNGKLYFFADINNSFREFVSYDPATPLVPPVPIGNSDSFGPNSFAFSYDGWVYFKEDIGGNTHLFRTDGINPPVDISIIGTLTNDPVGLYLDQINKILYFFQKNGELFSFNLQTLLKIQLTAIGGTPYTSKTRISSMNGNLYFTAFNGATYDLYRSDGLTLASLLSIESYLNIVIAPDQIIVFNNNLYFGANGSDGYANELWKSDGNISGAVRVSDINTGGNSYPFHFFNWNNYLYFIADDGSGNELYRTDGTAVELIHDSSTPRINTNSVNAFDLNFSFEPNMKYFNNKLYMRANDVAGVENKLWVTDGIPGGDTHSVYNFFPGNNGDVFIRFTFNNKLFMSATTLIGNDLWLYDPDKMSVPVQISYTNIQPKEGVVLNNRVYFSATDPAHGRELWVLYYK